MKTITIPLPADARNHTSARCPQCGGMIRNASTGGVPGDVACLTCNWTARWVETTGELAGQAGPSQAVFEVRDTPPPHRSTHSTPSHEQHLGRIERQP